MAWNNGFPATYPQYQQFQQPVFQQPVYQQPAQQQTQPAPQMMTPPTIRAEIVQVDGEDAAAAFPVGAGASQMMIAKDESAIYIKSATANGQTILDVYTKRPPAPPAPKFNPAEYVRRDEAEKFIKETIAAYIASTQQAKLAKEDK